ncbi:MAG: molybdopterin converting factor subunit 1 [Pseudomonadota bacterium]
MKLLYFAWVRSRIGIAEEDITPPGDVTNVTTLIEWLRMRGAGYALAFADLDALRVAVNQEHESFDAAIKQGDEIAFFPPVTGG